MTTRGIRVRTPRKDKIWATDRISRSVSADNIYVMGDLMTNYKVQRGIFVEERPTFMRLVGHCYVDATSGDADTTDYGYATWGLAWVPSIVRNAGDGDAQIPDPTNALREAPWIHRDSFVWQFGTTDGHGRFPRGPRVGYTLDIRQMRKPPAAEYDLVIILNVIGSHPAGGTSFTWVTHTMLAV